MPYLPEYQNEKLIRAVPAPKGYTSMNVVSCYFDNVDIKDDKLMIEVKVDGQPGKYPFEIDVNDLAERDIDNNQAEKAQAVIVDNGKALLMMDEFYLRKLGYDQCFFRFSGVLFTK